MVRNMSRMIFLSQSKPDAAFLLGGFTIIKEFLQNSDGAMQQRLSPENSSPDQEKQRNDIQVSESVNNIISNPDGQIRSDTKKHQFETSDGDNENDLETCKSESQSECSTSSAS